MAAIASIQFAAGVRAPASAAKSLKATSSSSSFMGARVAAPARSVRTAAAGGLKVEARYDAGVGVFGNKAGMTQLFTDEGLCVPVTVIAVQAGNVVTQVRTPSMTCDFSSSYARPSTPRVSLASRRRATGRTRDAGIRGFRALASAHQSRAVGDLRRPRWRDLPPRRARLPARPGVASSSFLDRQDARFARASIRVRRARDRARPSAPAPPKKRAAR